MRLVDLFLFLRVRLNLLQLDVVVHEGLAILHNRVKVLVVLFKLEPLAGIACLPCQRFDTVDNCQRIFGLKIFGLLGRHVGAGLAADESALGIHRPFAKLVVLQGRDTFVVEFAVVRGQIADVFRFLGQFGVAEAGGDLVHLIQAAGQFGEILLGFFVDLVLFQEQVILLVEDGLKGSPLDPGRVLHGPEAMLGQAGDIGLHAAEHHVADRA